MVANFDDLRSVVRNYNKRRNRMEKAGYKNVPPPAKVSELRRRYAVDSDLAREAERLKNLGRGDVIQKVDMLGGVKAIKWEYDYLKENIYSAKDYFEREYMRVSKRVARFPGERTYLDTLAAKINLLNHEVDFMSQKQFRSAIAAATEFATAPTRLKTNYRAFMSEVDAVMDRLGYSAEQRQAFFKKFEQLTPSQFLYLYDNNDIIGRVYELADSPEHGELKINTTEDDAKDKIDTMMEEADNMIKDAKKNAD